MPAAAAPRQTGLKRLAAALAPLCLVLFLLAIENRYAVEAWRGLRDETGPAVSRVADWAVSLPSGSADGLAGLRTAVVAEPRIAAADPDDAVLTGEFGPANEVTRAVIGSVVFAGAELRFEAGDVLRTQPLRISAGREAFAAGRTFAGQWDAPADAQIELRRIAPNGTARTVAPSTPCAGAIPGEIALLHRKDRVDMMVFRAGAVPGPDAPGTALCGLWSFRRR